MKIRVTGRFYLVLLLIALIVVFIFRGSIFASSEVTVIYQGTASDTRQVKGVIVRDEAVVSEGQVSRVDYLATELTLVKSGDVCANVYTMEYSTRLINELNNTRKNIQAYHKIVLGNELDAQLEVLNLNVHQRAEELKSLVKGKTQGDLNRMVRLLTQAMEDRRSYMSQNRRSDSKLIKYYDDENQRLNAISSWQVPKPAPRDGLVSFYLDGYEDALNQNTVSSLEISDIRTVLQGGNLKVASQKASTNVYRVMDQNHWYILLIADDGKWNPTLDTVYSFVLRGYDELAYEGTVIKVVKNGSTVMATLEINQPIGPLAYARSGDVTIGANMNGLIVSRKAVSTVSGQTGLWLYDVPGGTFVPIEILTYRSDGTVLFTPLVEGVLSQGAQVLIK